VTSAEDAADETIDRVAKKLLAGEVIHKVNAYLLGVARKVASEILKKPKDVPISDVKEPRGNPINYEKEQETRRRERCVLHSLELLSPEQRELIIEWYTYDQGEKVENRRRLAARRECTVATLKVQAFRVREKLRRLVEECMRTLP
jgi:DNA-directed RNA polymerase specialized sigma24 family protein